MTPPDLHFWNTTSGTKEAFIPRDRRRVRMYVCGPTVYDRAHIGNARPAVVFDVLFRLLRCVYGQQHVVYVRNITDIDDKINTRAQAMAAAGDTRPVLEIVKSLTRETTAWYHEDLAALHVLTPSREPRATEFIPDMIDMITVLLEAGHAYVQDDHVLFDVQSDADYGSLSGRRPADLIAGARVEVAPYKRNPADFVRWKPSDDDIPGWSSPWGRGRPGWHIECSAMSLRLLGRNFDIHGGGADLLFPHHENECAQSRCANPEAGFAAHWMHNGLITVDGSKMAKSLGNVITVHDLLQDGISGEEIRYVMLGTHYRQQLDWTQRRLDEARSALQRWSQILADAVLKPMDVDPHILAALADDLNTPAALTRLHQLAAVGDSAALGRAMQFLGLLSDRTRHADIGDGAASELIDAILAARAAARRAHDYALADRLRDDLQAAGVVVKDGVDGSEWSPVGSLDMQALATLAAAILAKG